MAQRTPNARQLGSMYIPNWRLVFRNVADIEQSHNSDDLLPVGVWELTEDCEKALDFYEGFPNLYKKIEVNGIMTYKMNSTRIAPPSKGYFNGIVDGYKDFGLNSTYLFNALGQSHFLSEHQTWSEPRPKKKFKRNFFTQAKGDWKI
jgi:hypothetical protein